MEASDSNFASRRCVRPSRPGPDGPASRRLISSLVRLTSLEGTLDRRTLQGGRYRSSGASMMSSPPYGRTSSRGIMDSPTAFASCRTAAVRSPGLWIIRAQVSLL